MPAHVTPGHLAEFGYRGKATRFFVKNVADIVQGAHLHGTYYEQDCLEVMETYLTPGGVFLDVGANVGNHAVYVSKYGGQRVIVVIEPNPEAIALLRLNLLLNAVEADISYLGVGLSDRAQNAEAHTPENNLGGTRMAPTADGPLKLVTGDSLFAGRHIDFIKIDVEGQEIAVLTGLARTIAGCRPTMFVEVNEENRSAFGGWLKANAYEVAYAFDRYRFTQNVIVRPKAAAA